MCGSLRDKIEEQKKLASCLCFRAIVSKLFSVAPRSDFGSDFGSHFRLLGAPETGSMEKDAKKVKKASQTSPY